MNLKTEILSRLRVHYISGYEWECNECHYHFAEREVIVPFRESRVIPKLCDVCGRIILDDENVDSTGRPSEHERLVDLDALLELLDTLPAA